MRTETTTKNIYTFDELPEEIQEKAIDKLRDINVDHEWWEYIYDDAKEIGKLMGIKITNIYFSGFSSQGDGACFEGEYFYNKGGVKALKDYAPQDKELHRIVKELQKIERPAFYHLYAYVKHRGHYYHEMETDIEVRNDYRDVSDDEENGIKETLRDFMRWIYRTLKKEFEYLTGEEAIRETIIANEYEFDENGNLV